MPDPANTLLIEGTFEELAEELAQYLDGLKKSPSEDGSTVHAEVMRLLEQNKKDEVLKRLVTASTILNSAPEKEFTQTYNLLVHLVRQSPNVNMFLARICQNLSNPIPSSPMNGPGMALAILSTIFNILQSDNDTRYHVFLAILSVVRNNGMYETLRPQLKNIDRWISEWESDEEDQQKLFLEIANVAEDAGEDEESYLYLLRALRTIPASESNTPEARKLALRALTSAFSHPTHFDFQDLIALDPVQSLRKSDPTHFDLLEIFNAKLLDDYDDFLSQQAASSSDDDDDDDSDDDDDDDDNESHRASHNSWLRKNRLDPTVLRRKMRLLTLASLAASTPTRSLPYQQIASALQIPDADVEMWVIDVIRAGLVEGKLSQLNQTFLIHRSTYRVFGEKQWREIAARLLTWRDSLRGVVAVLQHEREHATSSLLNNSAHLSSSMGGGPRDYEARLQGMGMSGNTAGGGTGGGAGRRAGGGGPTAGTATTNRDRDRDLIDVGGGGGGGGGGYD